jgi:hypothetical protein
MISNWVYLGAGLTLGVGLRYLFGLVKNSGISVTPKQELPTLQLQQSELAIALAQEMSQFKGGFLARTTHELRSPLSKLISLHQLILSDLCENPEEEREFITQAYDSAKNLMNLMDEILNVARIEYGTNKLDIQPRSLVEILQQVYKLSYMLAENRKFHFQISPPSSEIYVLVDFRWLQQVLLNLVETAIFQMEEGGIYISTAVSPRNDFAYIWLDIPSHAVSKSEPVNLVETHEEQSTYSHGQITKLSPGMKLLLNQTLLEVMGGKLEIVSYTPTSTAHNTRLQLSVPVVIPEDVE